MTFFTHQYGFVSLNQIEKARLATIEKRHWLETSGMISNPEVTITRRRISTLGRMVAVGDLWCGRCGEVCCGECSGGGRVRLVLC